MSWRFRKTFKVLPGIKLNLTRHGLSATLGAAPFSVNVGPRGVYRNVSIPGTGIWDRQRIGGPSPQPSSIRPPTTDYAGRPTIPPLLPSVSPSPDAEIHSASTELLTSESFEHLRRLLTDAYDERGELTKEISSTTFESSTATRRYQSWERGFLMKRLFKKSFATRKEMAETAVAKLEELQEQLRLTVIATEITVDREQAEPYYRMRDDFAAVSECQKIWNVLTEQAIDRIAARSTADTLISRKPVSFSLDSCDLIEWENKLPHLRNLTGGDMYVYPGFILYRASKQAFALIDSRDVTLTFVSTQFTETETVPSDTQIVGQTWAKSNKDGTPDRRFNGNYQIPVAHYGSLLFKSPDGLDVRYVCSNPRLAEQFAKSWTAFRMSFHIDSGGQRENDERATGRSQTPIDVFRKAFEASQAVFEIFNVAQEKFLAPIRGVSSSDPECKATMTKEDLTAFITAVKDLILANKHLEESAGLLSRPVRSKFRRAVQDIDESCTAFEASVSNAPISDENLFPFTSALTEFVKARIEFMNAANDAVQKRRGKG